MSEKAIHKCRKMSIYTFLNICYGNYVDKTTAINKKGGPL